MTATEGQPAVDQDGAGFEPVVLPADRPRPDSLSGPVARSSVELEGDVADQLARHDDRGESTILAALATYSARVTGLDDLLVGAYRTSDAGDPHVVAVPVSMGDDPTFEDLRAVVQRQLAETPRRTVDQLLLQGDEMLSAGRHPVFQVAVATPRSVDDGHPPCDIVVEYGQGDDGSVEVRLAYPEVLFGHEQVRVMVDHLAGLIRAAIDGSSSVHTVEVRSAQEVAQLRQWNDTAAPLRTETLPPLLTLAGEEWGDRTAIVSGDRTVSYDELFGDVARLRSHLRGLGAAPDVPVAISLDRSVEMIVALLSVVGAGAPYVPIDPAYPAHRRRQMLQGCGAGILVTAGAVAEDLLDDSGSIAAPAVVDLSAGVPAEAVVDTERSGDVGPLDLGYVIYTSGSTGAPKGVALTQQALANMIDWQLSRPDFEAGCRTLQYASLSFDVSFQEIVSTFASGGTLVLVDETTRRDSRSLLQHMIDHRVERVFLPFVALRGLAEASLASAQVPEDLREVYTAGEQLIVDGTVRRFFSSVPGCLLENQYGPSESHVVSAFRLSGAVDGWPALPSIGAPIQNSELHVLDAHRRPVPVGVPGELFIAGRCLARGYFNRPDLTAERFLDLTLDGRPRRGYRTGDRARWTREGNIEFLGRLDNQVKLRGFRIEPGEVSAVLSEAPGVSRCVATVREGANSVQHLVAYLLAERGSGVDVAEVHRFARDRLPDFMVPSRLQVLEELPLTPSGKVDLKSLPEPSFDRAILEGPLVGPRTGEEHVLASIWRELLDVSDVGVHDDFFVLGGDSLLAVEMFTRIADQLGRDLPLSALGRAPTIAGLAELLTDPTTDAWQPLVPIRVSGDRLPLFCVHGGSGNVASFPLLARALPSDRPVYALQWDGFSGVRRSNTIEAMAERYVDEVRTVQPRGPYLLTGQCIGGLVAQEMARQLRERGEEVPLVVMWDSPHLRSPDYVSGRRRSELERILRGRGGRKQRARYHARRLLRRSLADSERNLHASVSMVRAVWRYRFPVPGGRTAYVTGGESQGSGLALSGHWTDGALGWAHLEGPDFAILRVETDHDAVPYHPDAVSLLNEELERVDPS